MDIVLNQISKWVHHLSFKDLPKDALNVIKGGFLDTLSTTLSGSQLESTQVAMQVASLEFPSPLKKGTCTLIGFGSKAGPMTAALINGTASHAELFDDNSEPMIAHPSSPIVNALLPLAQIYKLNGTKILTAYAAGFEVSVGLGRLSNPQMYERGWHVTRSLGILGATAACAKLLDLNESQIQSAIGIASSMASGVRQNFGTMTMALHVGLTARDAIHCALLAKNGFLSADDSLSGKFGYFNCFNGRQIDSFDIGNSLELLRSGLIFKPYPSGAPTHAAIEAAISIHNKLKGNFSDIQKITCLVHPWNSMTLKEGQVSDTLRARVSMRFCVAVALKFGEVTSKQFSMEILNNKDVKFLMQIVDIQIDDNLPDNGLFPAAVKVMFKNGKYFESSVDIPPGSPQRGWSKKEAEMKLLNCASGIISIAKAKILFNLIQDLENQTSLNKILNILEAPKKPTAD